MTRINVVPVQELHSKHLLAEVREIMRMGSYVQKSLKKYEGKVEELEAAIPKQYKMGAGHVMFFYDKLHYLFRRYVELLQECHKRGFRVQPYDWSWRLTDAPKHWFNDWEPDDTAIKINKERIRERLGL